MKRVSMMSHYFIFMQIFLDNKLMILLPFIADIFETRMRNRKNKTTVLLKSNNAILHGSFKIRNIHENHI